MNKILNFYFKKVFKTTFIVFFLILVMVFTVTLLPIGQEAFLFMESIFLVLLFPLATFSHKEIAVRSSVHWLLLTPIKKKDIFFANGIINLLKLIISSALVISYYLFTKRIDLAELDTWFIKNQEKDLTSSSLSLLLLLVGFFIFSISALKISFAEKYKDYQNPNYKQLLQKPKYLFYLMASGILISIYLEYEDSIPSLLTTPFVLTILFFGASYSVLETLNVFYRPVYLNLSAGICFIFFSGLLFLNSINNLSAQKPSLITSIHEISFLGFLGTSYQPQILNRLTSEDEDLTKLKDDDVKYLLSEVTPEFKEKVVKHWGTKCNQRKDLHCRLTFYANSQSDLLKLSCPEDIRSCLEMTKLRKRIPASDRDYASSQITKACQSGQVMKKDFNCKNW